MSKSKEDAIFRARQSREGKKGGMATLKRHGSAHFVKMAKARWGKKSKNA